VIISTSILTQSLAGSNWYKIMARTGKHRIYRFSNNYSASDEPVVYSISGAKLTTIREFRGANTNVPAALDSAAFPSSSNQAPPLYLPKALAQGSTMQGGSVQTSPTATKRRFYSTNMNQVYLSEWDQDATTQELSNITRSGSVTMPTYWSTLGPQSNLLHAEVDPIIKRRLSPAMSYLSSSALGEKLYFPLGRDRASYGMAALTINPDNFEASTWEAYETDLRSTYDYTMSSYQSARIFTETSDKYVTVSMYYAGIAFYNTSSLEWLGNLQLPAWQNGYMAVGRINIREFGGKKYLAVAVSPQSYSGSTNTNKVPKMLLYDVDAIDPADLSQNIIPRRPTPANTTVPIGVIFGSGSTWYDEDQPPQVYGYDAGHIPGSEIYISGEGDPVERIGCAVQTHYWTEIYDISHLIIENSITAGDENPASITSSYSALTSSHPGTAGLDIDDPDNLATLSNWLDTFAISNYPPASDVVATVCTPGQVDSSGRPLNEGPPKGARARHSWGELSGSGYLARMTQYGGTCWAGSYILPDCSGTGFVRDGFAVLSMESSSVSLAGFKVNWGGILTPHLGMPAMAETYSDLNFISSSNPLSGGWIAGSVRASLGTFVAQLPPENDLATINLALHAETATPWAAICGSASWEPTGASGLLPDGEYYSSSHYRYYGGYQATAMLYSPALSQSYKLPFYFENDDRYECLYDSTWVDPALDPETVYKSCEVNINSTLAWNAWLPFDYPDQTPPTLAEFSGYGGFEFLGGDIHLSADRFGDVIFMSDRSSNATYAFSANPGSNCVMLDKTGWVPSPRGCAVASASIDGKTWLASASPGQKFLNFSYWDDNSKTFDTNLTVSSSFFRTALCYRAPGSDSSYRFGVTPKGYGVLGIRAPVQGTNPVELSDTVNHIWQSISNNAGGKYYASSFDVALTPISELEANSGSASDKGFVECTSSLSRLRRVTGSTGYINNTLVHYGTESFDSLRGKFTCWGAKQVGKYVISFLDMMESGSGTVTQHYAGVHELTWSQATGYDVPEYIDGWPNDAFIGGNVQYWTTATQARGGAPTQEILVAKPIRVIPLTDTAIVIGGEGNIITVSPNEDYVAASNSYGTYLLYMGAGDLSSSAGYPKPVAGLSMWTAPLLSASDGETTMWRGWRMGLNDSEMGGNISTGLSGAMWNDRVGKAPTWPLVNVSGSPFPQLPPDKTRNPPIGTPANPGQIPFGANFPNTCEFKQEGDNLYFYVQTDPLTMWLVLTGAAETYAATPCNPATDPYGCSGSTQVLEFVSVVGLDNSTGRARWSLRARENIYWFGDFGGWTT
jgi:hypothetical protein